MKQPRAWQRMLSGRLGTCQTRRQPVDIEIEDTHGLALWRWNVAPQVITPGPVANILLGDRVILPGAPTHP
jgi:hypothetical protein